ncbi:hypothetical protein M378DRAFT_160857, partial [Amanita muscaria Koide BX008]
NLCTRYSHSYLSFCTIEAMIRHNSVRLCEVARYSGRRTQRISDKLDREDTEAIVIGQFMSCRVLYVQGA